MRSQSRGTIGVRAVLIPIAGGWMWPGGRVSVLICLRCRKQIPGSSKLCLNCGLDLYGAPPPRSSSPAMAHTDHPFCTACGRRLKPGGRFCGSCAEPVS